MKLLLYWRTRTTGLMKTKHIFNENKENPNIILIKSDINLRVMMQWIL